LVFVKSATSARYYRNLAPAEVLLRRP
jgi:hypothetical protein